MLQPEELKDELAAQQPPLQQFPGHLRGRRPCPLQDVTKKHARRNRGRPGKQPGATGHQDWPTRATNRHGKETQTRQSRPDIPPIRELERDARGRQGTTLPFRSAPVLGSAPVGSALTLLPVESRAGDSTPTGVTGTPDESQLVTRPPSGSLRRSSLEPTVHRTCTMSFAVHTRTLAQPHVVIQVSHSSTHGTGTRCATRNTTPHLRSSLCQKQVLQPPRPSSLVR